MVLKLVLGGTETPKGREMRSRRPSAAGRRKGPEAVTEQETGYITADTLQSKVFICTLAAEAHTHLQYDSSGKVRRKKDAMRHRSCASKGSCSPAPADTRTGGKSQPDWQHETT